MHYEYYYYIMYEDKFLIKQRDDSFIWKKLYDFPESISQELENFVVEEKTVHHKLTHKNLEISISKVILQDEKVFKKYAQKHQLQITDYENSHQKSFPKPLENYLKKTFEN